VLFCHQRCRFTLQSFLFLKEKQKRIFTAIGAKEPELGIFGKIVIKKLCALAT
jgi:hypothetical protein